MLDIVASYHGMQFQGKLMNQNLRKWQKNPYFGPNFENLTLSATRCYGQLLSCTIPEKTNYPILRTDRQTEWTDRQVRVIS